MRGLIHNAVYTTHNRCTQCTVLHACNTFLVVQATNATENTACESRQLIWPILATTPYTNVEYSASQPK